MEASPRDADCSLFTREEPPKPDGVPGGMPRFAVMRLHRGAGSGGIEFRSPGQYPNNMRTPKRPPDPRVLQRLQEQVRALERGSRPSLDAQTNERPGLCPLGTTGPVLEWGAVHEWFGSEEPWVPPMGIFVHLARQAVLKAPVPAASGRSHNAPGDPPRAIVWVGRRVWPYPRGLLPPAPAPGRSAPGSSPGGSILLQHSVFLDCPEGSTRLWAMDLALRNPSVALVAADGSGLSMAATRRLQLAAEAGGSIVLLARPPGERARRSAATTRWEVRSELSPDQAPRWTARLLRCKNRVRAA